MNNPAYTALDLRSEHVSESLLVYPLGKQTQKMFLESIFPLKIPRGLLKKAGKVEVGI